MLASELHPWPETIYQCGDSTCFKCKLRIVDQKALRKHEKCFDYLSEMREGETSLSWRNEHDSLGCSAIKVVTSSGWKKVILDLKWTPSGVSAVMTSYQNPQNPWRLGLAWAMVVDLFREKSQRKSTGKRICHRACLSGHFHFCGASSAKISPLICLSRHGTQQCEWFLATLIAADLISLSNS